MLVQLVAPWFPDQQVAGLNPLVDVQGCKLFGETALKDDGIIF